jgi:hypothetical protein
MNDLLWLANDPLWGNVVDILTSQDPDTLEGLEGLESRLSIGIRRISAKLSHSTELELRKLHQIWTDSNRASALELLWGLSTIQEVLQPSKPHLSLYSMKNELRSTIGS